MNDFYVDNGLDGAGSVDEAIKLLAEMQELFELGGFVLRKWKSREPMVFVQIPHELVDSHSTESSDIDHFTKVFGVEWNATLDTFLPVVTSLKQVEMLTKRNIAIGHSKIVRCFGLVFSSDRQTKNSPSTCGGKKCLGLPCFLMHPCSVAMMAFRTLCSTGTGNTTEVFPKISTWRL